MLCTRYTQYSTLTVIHSFAEFIRLSSYMPIDTVICGLGRAPDDFHHLLNLPKQPVNRCILLADKTSDTFNKFFLTAGFSAIVSKQNSLHEFIRQITAAICSPPENPLVRRSRTYRPQERDVLCALLRGERPEDIAFKMNISYRTVSRYKQSALTRAGVEKFNHILTCQKKVL